MILDHGLYQRIPERVRVNYCLLWEGLVLQVLISTRMTLLEILHTGRVFGTVAFTIHVHDCTQLDVYPLKLLFSSSPLLRLIACLLCVCTQDMDLVAESAKELGVGQYADVLSLMLTGRAVTQSDLGLGEDMTKAQRKQLVKSVVDAWYCAHTTQNGHR